MKWRKNITLRDGEFYFVRKVVGKPGEIQIIKHDKRKRFSQPRSYYVFAGPIPKPEVPKSWVKEAPELSHIAIDEPFENLRGLQEEHSKSSDLKDLGEASSFSFKRFKISIVGDRKKL